MALSPTTASNNGDFDNDGYTNLEEYLNDLAAFKAAGPLEFQASLGRYADWTNWTRRWEPSRVDDVHINDGDSGRRRGRPEGRQHSPWHDCRRKRRAWRGRRLARSQQRNRDWRHGDGQRRTQPQRRRLWQRGLEQERRRRVQFHRRHAPRPSSELQLCERRRHDRSRLQSRHARVDGDLTLNSGLLLVEIGGTAAGQFDTLDVSGLTTLGGVLQFVTVDLGGGGYVPQLGDQFTFLNSAGGIEGEFDSMRFPAIGEGLKWQVVTGEFASYLAVVSAALAGDYNDNGTVDAADYTTWRNALDNNTPLLNETETPGVVDAADYDAWKANFGATAVGAGSGAVPEPVGGVLWLVGLGTGIGGFRKFRLGR